MKGEPEEEYVPPTTSGYNYEDFALNIVIIVIITIMITIIICIITIITLIVTTTYNCR